MLSLDLTTLKSSFTRYFKNLNKEENSSNNFVYLFEFAGPIGAGKTATTDMATDFLRDCGIENIVNLYKIKEDIRCDANKKAISDFYAGIGDTAELENTICGNRISSLIDLLNVALSNSGPSIILSDRAVEEDLAFIDKLRQDCDSEQYETLDKLETISLNIRKFLAAINGFQSRIIHQVIYLRPGLEVSLERIRYRGRPDEQQINLEKLKSLTTRPDAFDYGQLHIIENNNLSVQETALMAFERIIWNSVSDDKRSMPLHKVLVSFYGVPGSGKTHFVNALSKKLKQFSANAHQDEPGFAAVVCDESDEADIMKKQEQVYEAKLEALDADSMQTLLDSRRIEQFEELEGDHFCAFTFTDIGPETSSIFQKFTGSKPDDTYKNSFGDKYDICLNVIVTQGDLNVVREHIAKRGRPGEYEYFTEERLGKLSDIIYNIAKKDPQNYLFVPNDYSELAVDCMFKNVMQFLASRIMEYCKNETLRDKK